MKYVLLVTSAARKSTEGLHWAMHQAKEKKLTLKVAYVANGDAIKDTAGLAAIEKQARTFQVPFETQMVKGDYRENCENLAKSGNIEVLVAVDEKRNPLLKAFRNSDLASIQEKVPCEIKVYPSS